MRLSDFICGLPKAELHVHLEGTLEPELFLTIADRNKIKIPYKTEKEIITARTVGSYQDFYDAFLVGTQVLKYEQDFYDVACAYISKAVRDGVLHAEITFDTQTYTPRGIQSKTIINALDAARRDMYKEYGISIFFILCFLRHLSEQDALQALHDALPCKDKIVGIGLASTEVGNPPAKFKRLFEQARRYGYRTTAHVGEHEGASYIWQAINELNIERIDHGVRCMEDPTLIEYLKKTELPLTVCPLSNITLAVFPALEFHPVKKMLHDGLSVSLNSDDPAFFGGYIADVYEKTAQALNLTYNELTLLAVNSFKGSFLDESSKTTFIQKIQQFTHNYEKQYLS